MADFRDYQAAARDTDDALQRLYDYGTAVEAGVAGDDGYTVAKAVLIASHAIVLALREASVRADYVAHYLGPMERP